jgi:AcrR family transcriptional regulator
MPARWRPSLPNAEEVEPRGYATRVMERATSELRDFRPWRFLGGDRLDGRRRELFARAAPVFRRHGYRGATIKALAHACGLSAASLYHYFGSKEELATYILRRPRMDWDSVWVDPETDPLVQLAQLLDLSLTELPDYLLALRLADEIAGTTSNGATHARLFREGEAVFARLVAASAPGMSRATASRVARDALSAMVGSAILGLDPEPETAVRERVVAVLRAGLVPTYVEVERFDVPMGRTEQTARSIRESRP